MENIATVSGIVGQKQVGMGQGEILRHFVAVIQKEIPGVPSEAIYKRLAQAHRQSGRMGSHEVLLARVLAVLQKPL